MRSNEIAIGDTGSARNEPAPDGADPPPPPHRKHSSGGYNPWTDGENYGTYDN